MDRYATNYRRAINLNVPVLSSAVNMSSSRTSESFFANVLNGRLFRVKDIPYRLFAHSDDAVFWNSIANHVIDLAIREIYPSDNYRDACNRLGYFADTAHRQNFSNGWSMLAVHGAFTIDIESFEETGFASRKSCKMAIGILDKSKIAIWCEKKYK